MIFTLCFPASTSNRIEPTVVRPNDISLRFRPFFPDLFMEPKNVVQSWAPLWAVLGHPTPLRHRVVLTLSVALCVLRMSPASWPDRQPCMSQSFTLIFGDQICLNLQNFQF